ncbi:MAG: peptidoglycan editing factor PgeF [Deltaproteobacteria bacterium]|nr:peptidoglycan editing factor PgeF [Deltaproteobacteria bacterium]
MAGGETNSDLMRLPGVVHGFSTRPLDFGSQSANALRENHLRLAQCVGYAQERLFQVKQVHGREVVRVAAGHPPRSIADLEADALITDQVGITLGVVTADCMPVLILSMARPAIAAAHAGWRGLAAGVLEASVEALCSSYGCASSELIAAVGPCVSGRVYEVSSAVAAHFSAIEGAVESNAGRHLVDLQRVAAARLVAVGVSEVTLAPHCTFEEPVLFHSYRRSGAGAGRQLNVIGLTGRASLPPTTGMC